MVRAHRNRGFTLLEMAVVVLIIGIMAALGTIWLLHDKARANLATTSTELHALLRAARNNALQGTPTVVMFFPDYVNQRGGTGSVVLTVDPDSTFFTAAAAPNFDGYNPASSGGDTQILERLDFPRGTIIGPRLGMGAGAVLAAPYSRVAVNVACGFCSAGAPRRGAIKFDTRGRAWFYSSNGAPLPLWGASFSMEAVDMGASIDGAGQEAPGVRTFILNSATGSVRTIIAG